MYFPNLLNLSPSFPPLNHLPVQDLYPPCLNCDILEDVKDQVLFFVALSEPFWASQVTLVVKKKKPPANAGDVDSIPDLGRSLDKEMATHSSFLAWKIP